MKRFFVVTGLVLLALAAFLWYRLSQTPWTPAAPFDVIGFLWLLQNFPKLVLWVTAWVLVLLSLLCFWNAVRAPSIRTELEAEQRRLIGHLLVDPVRPRGRPESPPGAGGASEP